MNNRLTNNNLIIRKRVIIFQLILISIIGLLGACKDNEKEIPPPEIYLAGSDEEIEVNLGNTIVLKPQITYNYDAIYEWRKNGQKLDVSGQFLTDTAINLGNIEYFFKVITPYGSDSMTINVDVIILADFNELALSTETDTFHIGPFDNAGFSYKEIFFSNTFINDTTWEGFGISNMGSSSSDLEDISPFSVYASQDQSDYFLLVRHPNGSDSNYPTIQFNEGQDHLLKSIDINNSTVGRYLMKFGSDQFERMGGSGSNNADWCKVTIRGIDAQGEITGSVDFFLADYRFDNNKRDYIIEDWTTVDLSDLNKVNKIEFILSSSKTDDLGNMVTPEIFCIDNLKIL